MSRNFFSFLARCLIEWGQQLISTNWFWSLVLFSAFVLCIACVSLYPKWWLLVTSILFSSCLLLLRPLSRSLFSPNWHAGYFVLLATWKMKIPYWITFHPLQNVIYRWGKNYSQILIHLFSAQPQSRSVSFVSEKCWDSGRHNPDI